MEKNSVLSNVTKGKVSKSVLAIIYGPDGVGKSTFAANAPNPIFLGTEDGTFHLNVSRLPGLRTFEDVTQSVDALIHENHDYKTFAIDSIDWLEQLVFDYVCRQNGNVKSIEEVGGGFGKGYVFAMNVWRNFMGQLKNLRDAKGMHIILIGHSYVKAFNDPQQPLPYDRYLLKLNDKAAALWREFVDAVLFANYETFTKNDRGGKAKAYGSGARKIYTTRMPAYDAKNRLGLPEEIPLSWDDFYAAYQSRQADDTETLLSNIQNLIDELGDEQKKKQALDYLEKNKKDPSKLEVLQNRLRTILSA